MFSRTCKVAKSITFERFSVIFHRKKVSIMKKIQKIALTGLFAAMITVMTAYICHIPVGTNGGYVHFGDALIYLAAGLLPMPYAIAAAAIGGGLADLLTAPVWAISTIIIKSAICLPFSAKKEKIICPRNVIALVISGAITILGYAVAEGIMFGNWAAAFAGATGSLVQAGGSAVIFLVLGFALDKANIRKFMKN